MDYLNNFEHFAPGKVPMVKAEDKQLDLNTMIAQGYFDESKTLNLDSRVKGEHLIDVLESIRKSGFYHQIHFLFLGNNQLRMSFNYDAARLVKFPPNVRLLDLSRNELSGTEFPWIRLPSTLENLYLQQNRLQGTINWRLLPENLRVLWIFENELKGRINWNDVPDSLTSLGIPDSMLIGLEQNIPDSWTQQKLKDFAKHNAIFFKLETEPGAFKPFLL